MKGFTRVADCSVGAKSVKRKARDRSAALAELRLEQFNKQELSTYLIVRGTESPLNSLIIQHCHLKSEVLFQVLQNHDQEGQLDSKSLFWVYRRRHICCCYICTTNFQHRGLDIMICDALDMSILDCKEM